MVAIQNIFFAVAAGSTVVSACCAACDNTIEARYLKLRNPATAATKSAVSQISASTELEKAFPDCNAAIQKLDKSKLPKYHSSGSSITFINPPKVCLDDATKIGTKSVEGASFAVSGTNIVVSHANPTIRSAFQSLFGSTQASQA